MTTIDSFKSRATLQIEGRSVDIFRLDAVANAKIGDVATLPISLKILLENLLRNEDNKSVDRAQIEAVAKWDPKAKPSLEIAFRPARVLLQDFTGVPAVVDLAAMREAFGRLGGDPNKINPLQPVDLVIDHSVQVDTYGTLRSFKENVDLEFQRNQERYQFLRWGQRAFRGMRVVPPGTGIVHQVNLEYLATGVFLSEVDGKTIACPDSLVGTDSHTTMINGLGVLGWGVGGIEAEAAMLGQPMSMLLPEVVGFKLRGKLREGATATDLVLTVTEMLRKKGVVGKFVEFYGEGLNGLSLPDRATIANMAPEYGATMGFFPVDDETLSFMRFSGRSEALVRTLEAYTKAQGMFRTHGMPDPRFSDTLELDLADVVPSIAGPKRPQDRVILTESKRAWRKSLVAILGDKMKEVPSEEVTRWLDEGGAPGADPKPIATSAEVTTSHGTFRLGHGSVVIAAITSCTNTSNPAVMLAAGLVARKAVEAGLTSQPWVKTSLAPGSQVVTDYLVKAGVMPAMEALGFNLVGYGCTTCIGNSGPLDPAIEKAIKEADLVVASALSGNRNFEGRVHPMVRANYLASPPLVVAYALAGRMDIDFEKEPIGHGKDGKRVFLRDLWPSQKEITDTIRSSLDSSMFESRYSKVLEGPEAWRTIQVPEGATFKWIDDSTYIRRAPFFDAMTKDDVIAKAANLEGARVLAMLGDSVTTDHISPAGNIKADSPAGKYLQEHGVSPRDFNQYGARRGNHEVMVRGTFANVRLRNELAPGTEGGVTRHMPDGAPMSIYDASVKYKAAGVPSIILAGKEYGSGSSRDWAAKGPMLLGVRAVIAESFERIHRSNLVGMGILPLEFVHGESRVSLGLNGEETYAIRGLDAGIKPGMQVTVHANDKTFHAVARIDTPQEVEYYLNGGILQYVLRQLLRAS